MKRSTNIATMQKRAAWQDWGKRLRAHAKARNVDWRPLITELDVTDAGFRHWLNGTRSPKMKDFFRMCEYAKADARLILFGESILESAVAVLRNVEVELPRLAREKVPGEIDISQIRKKDQAQMRRRRNEK